MRLASMLLALAAPTVPLEAEAAQAPAQPALAAPADFEELRIGGWLLRTDREAAYFSLERLRPGVIEMATRSRDGRIDWHVRDNGGVLEMHIEADRCSTLLRVPDYAALARYADLQLPDWRELFSVCSRFRVGRGEQGAAVLDERGPPPELFELVRDYSAAVDALKSRAQALWGPRLTRCMPDAPANSIPLHPQCPWPARIGQRPIPPSPRAVPGG